MIEHVCPTCGCECVAAVQQIDEQHAALNALNEAALAGLPPLPDIPGTGPLCGCGNRGEHVPNVDCDWPCSEPGIWRCTHEACRPS